MRRLLSVFALFAVLACTPAASAQDCTPPAPVPATTGNNLLANPDIENWTNSYTATNWTFSGSGASLSQSTDAQSGTYAAKITEGSSADSFTQNVGLGYFGRFTVWAKGTSGALFVLTMGGATDIFAAPADYAQFTAERHVVNLNPYKIGVTSQNGAHSLYVDNAALYALDESSLMSTCLYDSAIFTESANITLSPGSMAGIIQYNDVNNWVAAVIQPTGNTYTQSTANHVIHFVKVVNGVFAAVISSLPIVYTPGATITLVRTAARLYVISYNGAVVGNATISDAIFDAADSAGFFSTNFNNTFANFTWTAN